MVLPQALIHILHVNDGIVHKGTDGNTHTAEGHCIYIHPEQIEHNHSAEQ